ncbi:MAG: ABC-type transport auxiliary lipoprotein family protein [Marinobacter sp.]|uniref:ABC-type transport auxiliary lipoprotein family protein n=1 Tax=Marinobacter sp. TaxID=50741 RepID=UPI003C3F477D
MTAQPFAILTALGLALALSGCTVFPDREPPRVMDLALSDVTAATTSGYSRSLRVDTPLATEPFDSSRILTKPSPNEYQMYGKVRWRDTAPVLVRELIIGALRQEGRFDGVISETSPAASDLTLTSDLYGFHSESRDGKVRVKITLYGQIMDNRSRTTLCTRNFEVSEPAVAGDIDAVVGAFGAAGDDLRRQVRNWLDDCLG